MRLFNWAAKCQRLTVEEQLKLGVRHFDIRVKFEEGIPVIAHGLVSYYGNVYSVLETLDKFGSKEKVHVRILLEQFIGGTMDYLKFLDAINKNYPNIVFYGGFRVRPYEALYPYDNTLDSEMQHCYYKLYDWSCESFIDKIKSIKLSYPLRYAKKHNKERSYIGNIVMIDFVDIQ